MVPLEDTRGVVPAGGLLLGQVDAVGCIRSVQLADGRPVTQEPGDFSAARPAAD